MRDILMNGYEGVNLWIIGYTVVACIILFLVFYKLNLLSNDKLVIKSFVIIALTAITMSKLNTLSVCIFFIIVCISNIKINIDSKLKYTITFVISITSCVMIEFIVQWLCYDNEYMAYGSRGLNSDIVILGILLLSIFTSLVFLIIMNIRIAVIVSVLSVLIVSLVNLFIMQIKGTSLSFFDFTVISTALSVASNYKFILTNNAVIAINLSIVPIMIFSVCANYDCYSYNNIFMSAIHNLVNKNENHIKCNKINYMIPLLIIPICLIGLRQYDTKDELMHVDITPREYRYIDNGCAVNLYKSYVYGKLEQPENYEKWESVINGNGESEILDIISNEEFDDYGYCVNDILDINYNLSIKDLSTIEKPDNIVVIMAEALNDTTCMGMSNVTKERLMPYINKLYNSKESLTGYTVTSMMCGGTANCEFEALTGASISSLEDGVYPYELYLNKKTDSIVSRLKDAGYSVLGLHTFSGGGYNRDSVYRHLGFDDVVFEDDKYFENCEKLRGYIKDSEGFNYILDRIKEKDEKTFNFYVTMQCHGDFDIKSIEKDIKKYELDTFDDFVLYEGVKTHHTVDGTRTYLSLVNDFDRSFEKFMSEISEIDEKTLVIVFGDHNSGVCADGDNILGDSMNHLKGYITPIIVTSNYDISNIGSKGDILLSQNYIYSLIHKLAGLDETNKDKILIEMNSRIPVYSKHNYIDNRGNFFELKEDSNIKELMDAITYDVVK